MFSLVVTVLCFAFGSARVLRMPAQNMTAPSLLTLPSNATSIREEIVDTFNCTEKDYGYYADVDNGCQVFHVCHPVKFGEGRSTMYRWSFICPESTVFNQELLTCMREEDSIPCEDSPMFYNVNQNFGDKEQAETMPDEAMDMNDDKAQNMDQEPNDNQANTNDNQNHEPMEADESGVDLRNEKPTESESENEEIKEQIVRRKREKTRI